MKNPYTDLTLAATWRRGYMKGTAAADHTPINAECFDPANENHRDDHEAWCFESEMNARDFSPFEFLAAEINRLGDGDKDTPSSDEAWEAYDKGVAAGIRDRLKKIYAML